MLKMYAPKLKIMILVNIINLLMPASIAVIDPNCDFYQEMTIGKKYYIHNNEYPLYYTPSTTCRWIGKSPSGSVIVLTCDLIELPFSSDCQTDRLYISRTGDENLDDAMYYCGQMTLTEITESNALAVGLIASSSSLGGRFSCTLTAMQVDPPPTTTPPPNTCDCGWKYEKRIVGGNETGVNEYPLMSAIIDKNTYDAFCGAVIISNRYALTAAHCFNNKQPSDLGLLVGDHDLSTGSDTSAAALYRIESFVQHPQYDSSDELNDIGILRTVDPIAFSLYVGPVCLPFRFTESTFYAQTVTALGWGYTDFSGSKSDILQKVDLSIVSNAQCAASMNQNITDQQICTYAPDKDTCLSDSGGPLLWKDDTSGRLQLVGIISYGIGCATKHPAVNTRVTSYLAWILSQTRDAFYCIQ